MVWSAAGFTVFVSEDFSVTDPSASQNIKPE
jgi:hypothetical protein